MYALNIDKTSKRILSSTYAAYAPADAVFVKTLPPAVEEQKTNPTDPIPPEGNLHNYLYPGSYIYDPLLEENIDSENEPSDHELLMTLLGVSE